jgi:hypothetical protein
MSMGMTKKSPMHDAHRTGEEIATRAEGSLERHVRHRVPDESEVREDANGLSTDHHTTIKWLSRLGSRTLNACAE